MAHFRTDTNNLRSESKVTHEVVMLSDLMTPSGNLQDAFGRLRVSNPVTLFDSQHRYIENEKWNTFTAGSGLVSHVAAESAINLSVTGVSGDKVYRETKRVFAYQPGKSLLIMNTFAMAPSPFAGLRQRIGYFDTDNGVYLEQDGNELFLVLRSSVTGNQVNTRIPQTNWNIDKFDGTGYSATIGNGSSGNWNNGLDVTKGNIFWISIEWLGVGNVKCGFVVDSKFITAHDFKNDNIKSTTYMSTACLPCRYEIENTSSSSSSTLKQICSTVLSEGGFEISGLPRSFGNSINEPRRLTSVGVTYPVISIRLKPSRINSIVAPVGFSFFGITNGNYRYSIVAGADITGATWSDVSGNSSVQYNSNNDAIMAGGTVLESGYFISSAQNKVVTREPSFFRYQLERNTFSNTTIVLTLAAQANSNNRDVLGSIDWQEVV
jgi:hypothetical protein